MNLSHRLIRSITDGAKTEHRLPVDDRPHRTTVRKGRSVTTKAAVPHVGQVLPVHRSPRRGEPVMHVIVTALHQETHGDITAGGIKVCGYGNLEHYVRAWLVEHDLDWLARRARQIEGDAYHDEHYIHERPADVANRLPLDEVRARWLERWNDRPVWVLSIRPHGDYVRLLSTDGGYTTTADNALPGEPEAVSEADQERITERSGMEHVQWLALEQRRREVDRASQTLASRTFVAMERATNVGLSRVQELQGLRHAIKRGDNAAALERQVERAERRLDAAA